MVLKTHYISSFSRIIRAAAWRLLLLCFVISLNPSATCQNQFNINGYFSQAFAASNGNQILGIPSNGTTNYRNAALLFSFKADEKLAAHLQFRHRLYGNSPLSKLEKTIQFDWGFLRYSLRDNLSIKFGRVLLPLGIYNEIRDVGILLPFFQAPFTPYSEGNFTAKAFDGAMLSYSNALPGNWSAESDFYFGQFSWIEWFRYRDPFTNSIADFTRNISFRKALGSRLFLNSPLEGVRFGGSVVHGNILYIQPGRSNINGKGEGLTLALLSADLTRETYYLRSEFTALESTNAKIKGFYIQGGIQLHEAIWLNVQHDNLNIADADFFGVFILQDVDYYSDYIAGINFHYRDYIIKAEGHITKGFATEEPIDFNGPPKKTNFIILSLVTSF
ncbi:MAG: hypothetical protein ACRBF0_23845 [Calditrichia bacterium]